MRKVSALFLIFCLWIMPTFGVAAQGGCAVDDSSPAIIFGIVASLTGKFSPEGLETFNGFAVWHHWVNDEYGGINVGGECYRADIVYYDDQSDPDTVSTLVERLIIEDGANFILGPYSTTLTQVASVVTERENIIMMESNGADESLFTRGFQNLFGIITPASLYTETGINAVFDLGGRTAVIAYEDTAFSAAVAQGARDHLDNLGMQILAIERFPMDAADLTSMFTSFRELNPDLFIGSGHYNDAILFIRMAKELGFSPDAMFIPVGPSSPAFISDMGAEAEYIWSASQWTSDIPYTDDYFGSAADYADRYEQNYGIAPSYEAAEATASALALQLGIESAGTIDTDSVRDALQQLDVMTFYGPVQFDSSGKSLNSPMVAVQIQNNEIVTIAPGNGTSAIWPAPTWEER
jgi:branched-chain amino acid transport system substrate-binding protein